MQRTGILHKAVLAAALSLTVASSALAGDLYEEYHGGFGSGLFRGSPVKPDRYGPQPQQSLDPFIRRGLGDYDHDGMWDRFDYDADNDGMLNRFDRDPYDFGAW